MTSAPTARALRAAAVGALVLLALAAVVHGVAALTSVDVPRPVGGALFVGAFALAAFVVAVRAVLDRADRASWVMLAAGLVAYGTGSLLWLDADPWLPFDFPTPSDVLWVAFYLLAYASIVRHVRRVRNDAPLTLGADGLIAALSAGAVVLSIARPEVRGDVEDVATALLYPVGDLVLVALVLVALAVRSWRPDPTWTGLGLGFGAFAVADLLYALQQSDGVFVRGGPVDTLWIVSAGLLALGAHVRRRAADTPGAPVWGVVVPLVGTTTSVLMLAVTTFRESPVVVACAAAAVLVGLVRTVRLAVDATALAESRVEARTDVLTELPNRRAFLEGVESARQGQAVAVVLIDLDRFKDVNDSLGHPAGDELLTVVGRRFHGALRDGDLLARLGGDEFAVCCAGDERVARALVERLRGRLERPVHLADGVAVHVSASFGVAVTDPDELDVHELLRRADIALYDAKDAAATVVYDVAAHHQALTRLTLAETLRRGIGEGDLVVAFQPQVTLGDGVPHPHGVEALVRWQHPTRGLLGPGEFLGAARRAGLMPALTEAVLEQSLAACRRLRDGGHPLAVSVNLAPAGLLDPLLTARLAAAVDRHGLPPEALVLELTEEAVLRDRTAAGRALADLRAHGFATSIDDFGTGWSSLSYLASLPLDEVKVDRSFVAQLDEPRVQAVVRAVRRLTWDLGLSLLAEGVEDQGQARWVREAGVDRAQGYHFARPLFEADLVAWLTASGTAVPAAGSRD
ncbi:putative bifunctional diguanylate cyclase/phosphodiesterase [Cellulomonas endophytica]|uniref:putative bifunctional diguanylate cyclase/phosphodiesterase n=1 Tax=Cellulomonas endophytica TaxID=2494735 RepID=UPI00101182E5|nr:bifunctional diguanylate cyclase/phosphodiesterase [Cellulomonas endophytica]